jgi:acyl CoA:acetate/3-ketoacid CoA transferase alpha subunit
MSKQNILEAWVEWATELANEIAKGFEDGKFTIWEGLGLTGNALKLPQLIRRSKEFKDLVITEEMQKDLVAKFAAKFELENEKAEKLVEVSIKATLSVAAIAKEYVDIIKG